MDSLTVINIIGAPFSFGGFVGLVFGLFAPLAIYRMLEKYKHQAQHRFKLYVVLGVLLTYFLCFFTVREEKTAIITQRNEQATIETKKEIAELVQHVAECNQDFFNAIIGFINGTKAIGDQTDAQLNGLIAYVDSIANPPATVDAKPIYDPEHVKWFRDQARKWGDIARQIQKDRQQSIQNRNEKVIVRPACVKP